MFSGCYDDLKQQSYNRTLCSMTASSLSFSSDLVRGVHARASVERRSPETRERRAAAREEKLLCLSRLAPSVTRVVICASRAFWSTDQEKRETAC